MAHLCLCLSPVRTCVLTRIDSTNQLHWHNSTSGRFTLASPLICHPFVHIPLSFMEAALPSGSDAGGGLLTSWTASGKCPHSSPAWSQECWSKNKWETLWVIFTVALVSKSLEAGTNTCIHALPYSWLLLLVVACVTYNSPPTQNHPMGHWNSTGPHA